MPQNVKLMLALISQSNLTSLLQTSDGRILTHLAHYPDNVHPLRIGESEVRITLNPAIGNGTIQNDRRVIHKDLYDLITTYFWESA